MSRVKRFVAKVGRVTPHQREESGVPAVKRLSETEIKHKKWRRMPNEKRLAIMHEQGASKEEERRTSHLRKKGLLGSNDTFKFSDIDRTTWGPQSGYKRRQ